MSTTSIQGPKFFTFPNNGSRKYHEIHRTAASCTMNMDSKSAKVGEREDLKSQIPKPPITNINNLKFDRLQPSERDLLQDKGYEFGQFVAREALLDEEYWTAAWLRAESHWEDRPNERYIESYKRKFAEQEFSAIKKRQGERNGQKCMCIVTVKNSTEISEFSVKNDQPNIKRTVLKSIVGTLDLSIRHLLQGETFPGERVRVPLFCHISRTGPGRYGYIANLCVAKSARRQGVATNMMCLALESAKATGVEIVYVHVHRENTPAQEMYKKIGFEIVEEATPHLVEEKTYLLCMEMQKILLASILYSFTRTDNVQKEH